MISVLNEKFSVAVDPEEFHSFDEMIIPFKGRSSIKQYLPTKPGRVRAGVSGYIYKLEVYQGASGGRAPPSS